MRYYAVDPGSKRADHGWIIVGEHPADLADDGTFTLTPDGYGSAIILATAEQLRTSRAGRRALADWEAHDDSRFERRALDERASDVMADLKIMATLGDREAKQLLADGRPVEEAAAYLKAATPMRPERTLSAVRN